MMRRRFVDVIGVAWAESGLRSHSRSCMSGVGVGNRWSPYTYTDQTFSQSSAWPMHTLNEYPVSNPPDPLIHSLNIQSDPPDPLIHWPNILSVTWPMHTLNEYPVSHLPDPWKHWMNIWSIICLTYWLNIRLDPPDPLIHCLNIWSVIRLTYAYAE